MTLSYAKGKTLSGANILIIKKNLKYLIKLFYVLQWIQPISHVIKKLEIFEE